MATEASTLDSMIAEAREMQESGRYINGRVFHAMANEIGRLRKLVHSLGTKVTYVHDHLADEGDRCYLGSTNHADVIRRAHEQYSAYQFDTGDLGPDGALSL